MRRATICRCREEWMSSPWRDEVERQSEVLAPGLIPLARLNNPVQLLLTTFQNMHMLP